jgi:hypothetical protein
VYEAYVVSSSAQGGEQPLLTGLNADFGVAVGLSWIGSTGFLAVEEAISGFEVLKFNTTLAPFNRTVANGADAASELLLSINGGGGGGLTKISRDGSTALIRFSSSGSSGTISIRAGSVASMSGQVSSAFGNVLLSTTTSDSLYYNGGSLSPNGALYVLPIPIGSSTSAHDLFIANTTSGSLQTNITNSSSSGVSSINPDFSPDGSKIVFSRKAAGSSTFDLYTINSDGSGLTQLTDTPNFSETTPSWSPSGGSVAFAGLHLNGSESEAPALEAGEAANWNIYILTLAGANIVTPKTKLKDPPLVQVQSRRATFILEPFSKAQRSAATRQARAVADDEISTRAAKAKPKFSFRYQLTVTKGTGRKAVRLQKVSKRNQLTLARLSPGTYSARYKVEILSKKGGKTVVVGSTKFSPRASFTVP